MKTLIGIQARSASTRFPGKIYQLIGEWSVLEWVHRAAERASHAMPNPQIVVLGPDKDDKLRFFCEQKDFLFFGGHPDDLLMRYVDAAHHFDAGLIVRLTADCWNAIPAVIRYVARPVINGNVQYASNCIHRSWPEGKDVQVCSRRALEWFDTYQLSEREHPFFPFDMNLNIRKNFESHGFKYEASVCPTSMLYKHFSIDTLENLDYANKHYSEVLREVLADPG